MSPRYSLVTILFIRFITTIIFGVFYSSIVLILTTEFNFSASNAIGLGGMFFGFHYVLPILGGALGDKLIDFKRLFLCGKFFQIIGLYCLFNAGTNLTIFYIGIGCCLVDSLSNSVSVNMIFTKACEQASTKGRLVVFMRSQIWSNSGFLVAFFISGVFFGANNIHSLLLLCLALSIVTFFISIKLIPQFEYRNSFNGRKILPVLLTLGLMSSLAATLSLVFSYSSLSKSIIIVLVSIFSVILLPISLRGLSAYDKKNVTLFFTLLASSIPFWCIYMLCPTFLPLFLKNSVDRNILGIELPPQWIQLIGPIIEIVIGFVIARWFVNFSKQTHSIKQSFAPHVLGLTFAAAALSALTCGFIFSDASGKLQPSWLFLLLILLAYGETLLSPANFSMVGELAPTHLQGRLTGMAQLIVGVSVITAGQISENYLPDPGLGPSQSVKQYINVFGLLAFIAMITAILVKMYEKKMCNIKQNDKWLPQSSPLIKSELS